MQIQKPFDKGWGKPHPKCRKTITEYEKVLDKKGTLIPKVKDEVNFYDEIQARGECVEIKDVIKRYKLNLKDIPKIEIEETIEEINNMPSDWTEAQNVIARTKNLFSLMPKEEREMFNNNAEQFVKSMIEKDNKFNILNKKINDMNLQEKINNPGTTTQVVNPGTTSQIVNPGTTTQIVNPGTTTQVVNPETTTQIVNPGTTSQGGKV